MERISFLSNSRIYRLGIWDLYADWDSVSLNFKILRRVAFDSALFVCSSAENGITEDANCADVVVSSSFRFGDCCQWHSENIRVDSKEDLDDFSDLILKMRDITREIMGGPSSNSLIDSCSNSFKNISMETKVKE